MSEPGGKWRERGDQTRHFKSDFDFVLRLYDKQGYEVRIGDVDFAAVVFVYSPVYSFVASRKKGRFRNCFVEPDGRIHIVAKNHGLQPGMVRCELAAEFPDGIYPDGIRREYFSGPTGITLTDDDIGFCGDTLEGKLNLPTLVADIPVLGHIELVSDRAVYRVPVTGEAATREELPDDVPAVGYGYYGYQDGSDFFTIGEWDV